jgi:SH3-like domain-containing protein
LAAIPFAVLLLSAASAALSATNPVLNNSGIIVVNRVVLRTGDGEQFGELAAVPSADGHRVAVLSERGGWTKTRTGQDQLGWVRSSTCARLNSKKA